jgi:ABC-2 type transport system permease protein
MRASLKAELRKLATSRPSIAMGVLTVLYGGFAVAGAALAPASERVDIDRDTILEVLRGVADVAAPVALLVGVLAAAGEFRHGTIVPVLLAEPRRGRVMSAKVASQALFGAVVGLAGSLVALAAGSAFVASEGASIDRPAVDLAWTVAGVSVVAAVYGSLGAELGLLLRSQTAAATLALAWVFAIEEIVPVVFRAEGLRRWLLDGAADRLVHVVDPASSTPPLWTAAAVLAGALTLVGVPAALRTSRSDMP